MFSFFGWGKKVEQPIPKKCLRFPTALKSCRKANKGSEGNCKTLELGMLLCLAETYVPEAHRKHEKCVHNLYANRDFNAPNTCAQYEEDMKKSLKKLGLFPLKI
uniref:CHCH domain-containing protein n=1 Tax=Polytomella parva TaxID=51329 RepID=A0A7S0US07_9CHLO